MPPTHEQEIPLTQTFSSRGEDSQAEQQIEQPTSEEETKVPVYGYQDLIDVYKDAALLPKNRVHLKARGKKARIKSGGLPEIIGPYLGAAIELTGGSDGPMGLQFVAQPNKENPESTDDTHLSYLDSLIEDEHETVPGVVHKYDNRALIITTGECAAYCRFCTRGRLVGKEKAKTLQEIDQAFEYIRKNPQIKELIFSGGDPFVLPKEVFNHVIEHIIKLENEKLITSVRFGSRALIHSGKIQEHVFEGLERLPLSPHVMLHINHPYEITLQVKEGMDRLRKAGARLYSQTVLLAGVNDNREIMKELLTKIDTYGATPYYVFTCDPVIWGSHFKVGLNKIKEIFHQLRAEMTGVSGMVRIVIDVPGGHGKITLDEGFWIDERTFRDFKGKIFRFDEHDNVVPVLENTSKYYNGPVANKETVLFHSASQYG